MEKKIYTELKKFYIWLGQGLKLQIWVQVVLKGMKKMDMKSLLKKSCCKKWELIDVANWKKPKDFKHLSVLLLSQKLQLEKQRDDSHSVWKNALFS